MAQNRFDPSGYLTFDLARGRIGMPKADAAMVLPGDVLEQLVTDADVGTLGRLARALGIWIGTRLRERLGDGGDPTVASPEAFVSEMNGLLAVHGLGRAALEIYGQATLVRVQPGILPGPGSGPFLESLFSGLLGTFLAQDVRCLLMDGAGGRCVLVGNERGIRRAEELHRAGVGPEAIAVRLNQEMRAAREGAR